MVFSLQEVLTVFGVDGGGGERWGEAEDCVDLFSPPFPALPLKSKTKPQTKNKLRKIAIKEILK